MAEHPHLANAPSNDTLKIASYTPLPLDEDPNTFYPPNPAFLGGGSPQVGPSPRESVVRDSYVRDSYAQSTPNDSGMLLSNANKEGTYGEVPAAYPASDEKAKKRPLFIALIALAILAIILIAIIVPVYFTVIKPKNRGAASGGPSGGTSSAHGPTPTTKPASELFGGDGSTVKASNGSTFTYENKLGGIWYYDPENPYANNAYPNSWTPPLNTSWNFGTNRINGVNLGGWFVLEPFITPALYQKYPGSIDEWTLSQNMAADTAGGGINQLEDHYKTFITEQDFAEMAGAGLNWVRIPIPFWAIDKYPSEPFLEKVSWKYIIQALTWCRKYGIRVKLDLHTIPGSQNGYNHSGKAGQINFLQGTMGLANAQRAMNYVRIFTEFITQPEWKDVVVMFGIMNEPRTTDIGEEVVKAYNYEVYKMMREITGVGEGKGPYISFHDGFQTPTHWAGFLTGADRIVIDSHPYFAFDSPPSGDPIDSGPGPNAGGSWPARACDRWASSYNQSRTGFGVTVAGEWSNAINDCGFWLRGPTNVPATGNCDMWNDWGSWSQGTKDGVLNLAKASMDALRDWFFWTWKVNPTQSGSVESPFWSYQLGLRQGWMPKDPRTALGMCGPGSGPTFPNKFESWMTGGAGADQLASTYAWPPAGILNAAAPLPTYTPTGVINTLPMPTVTGASNKAGNGWFNQNDNTPAPTPISGCTYPDPWDAQNAAAPACAVGGAAPAAVPPVPPVATPDPTTAADPAATTDPAAPVRRR